MKYNTVASHYIAVDRRQEKKGETSERAMKPRA